MSDNRVAGFVTAVLIAPLVVRVLLGAGRPRVGSRRTGGLARRPGSCRGRRWSLGGRSCGLRPSSLAARAQLPSGDAGAYVHCAGLMYAPHNRLQNRIARLARPN
jgi:hypothetical protein